MYKKIRNGSMEKFIDEDDMAKFVALQAAVSNSKFLLKRVLAKIEKEHDKDLEEKKQEVQPQEQYRTQSQGYCPAQL